MVLQMKKIFEGLRVLDLTRVIAGPICTQMLADLGATVFKIERPGAGDDARNMAPILKGDTHKHWEGESAVFMSYNRGKKSITVDITTPEGADIVRSLAATCDVFVENFKVNNLRKLGLDYETIRAIKPDIIYCSITGFGQEGPYAEHAAYDFILQGMAGPMSTCGQPDGKPGAEPLRTAIPIVDIYTGVHANAAVTSALYHHARTGEGQYIDISLLDCGVALNGHFANSYLLTGEIAKRVGNTNPISSPAEVIASKDGPIVIGAGNNGQFSAVCRVLGITELSNDPRFSSNAERIIHRDELTEILTDRIAQYNRDEILDLLRKEGVPCGPINTMDQVFADPQVQHRQLAAPISAATDSELISLVRHPACFSKTPSIESAPPKLGADTFAVISKELGYDANKINWLLENNIISNS